MTLALSPALLGRDIACIRKTNQTPPKVSVIDVVQAITGEDARHAAWDVRNLCSSYPEVDGIFVHFRFPGRGQGKCWCRVKTVDSLLWRNFRMCLLDALKRLTSIVLSLPCGCLDHIGLGSFFQGSTRFFSDENEKALQDARVALCRSGTLLGRSDPLWDARRRAARNARIRSGAKLVPLQIQRLKAEGHGRDACSDATEII